MRLLVRSEAKQDVVEAANWYDERRVGLGDRFVGEYIDALAKIEAAPLTFGRLETVPGVPNLRRCPLESFPYIVIFRALPTELVVFVVVHTSRDAGVWLFRLE